MSYKFRVGDTVIIKDTNQKGTVVAHEQTKLNNNRVKVEYIVKTGDGFENYHAYSRKDLEMYYEPTNKTNRTYPRLYNYEHVCADGRTVILTAIVDKFVEYPPVADMKSIKKKYLAIGYAICHPDDKNNKEIGAEIALKRAFDSPFTYLESLYTGEFNSQFVTDILYSKALFIENNINKFITKKQ